MNYMVINTKEGFAIGPTAMPVDCKNVFNTEYGAKKEIEKRSIENENPVLGKTIRKIDNKS